MKNIINPHKTSPLKAWQWYIVLWLSGVISLAIVAGLFRILLILAKYSIYH